MNRRPTLWLATLLGLCSCGGGSDISRLTGAKTPVPDTPIWTVAVEGCQRERDCAALRGGLVYHLQTAKLLHQALPPGQPAPLSLDVAVIHLHPVSPSDRQRYGLIAGRDEVAAVVTLKDAQGTALRTFQVATSGPGYPTEVSTQDVYRQFYDDIVAALKT